MKRRVDSHYLLLMNELLKLLCEKDSLQARISHGDSLRYHVYDPKDDQSRLERITSTLKQVMVRHAEFVRLVLKKFQLEKETRRTPYGNSGYLKQARALSELKSVQEQLDQLVAA